MLPALVETETRWCYIIITMEEILEYAGYCTGEIVLYLITFGRHKPYWNYDNRGTIRELRIQRSTWLGWIFWGALFLLAVWLFSS
jgi:hypothetical protein